MPTDSTRELLAVGIFGRSSRIGNRIDSLLSRRTFSSRPSPARVCASIAVLCALTTAVAQAPRWIAFAQQLPPAFDVSVIKPNTSGAMLVHVQPSPGGRFIAENVTLRYLLMSAWNVNDFQIVNAPAWVNVERYDLSAKSEANPSGAEMSGPMLQALVTRRFKLSLHRDVRQLPVYALTAAKSGAKLHASRAGSCAPWSATSIAPLSSPLRQANDPVPCGFRGLQPVAGGWKLNMPGATMAELAAALSMVREIRSSVIDETGLAGQFDIQFDWKTDDTGGEPSIFTAIQEQIGLRLEPRKGPVEVLVIDHVEKPDAN